LRRFPAPPLWVWLTVLALWVAAGPVPLLTRARRRARTMAIAFGLIAAAAAAVTVVALALDAYASPGTWIEAVDVLVFLGVGVAVIWRGPRNLHIAAALWLGLVSAAVGLLEGAVFLHPIVLAVLPDTVMRLLVITALGAGASAAVIASTLFGEIADTVREHERRLARSATSPR
jgi:FtsH-binding integral membrane protein